MTNPKMLGALESEKNKNGSLVTEIGKINKFQLSNLMVISKNICFLDKKKSNIFSAKFG